MEIKNLEKETTDKIVAETTLRMEKENWKKLLEKEEKQIDLEEIYQDYEKII